ncbi:MAG: TonB-dependent receptor, partial [candidate division Zixibacteria bacterium]|nr:TonB-dependent receptor [candidate division Zixibacteria bacterium]
RLGRFGLGGFAEFNKVDNNRDNAGAERVLAGLRGEYLSAGGRHHVSFSGRYFDDSLGVPGPVPDGDFIPVYGSPEASSLTNHQKDENYSMDFKYLLHGQVLDEAQLDAFWEQKNLDYSTLYNYSSSYLVDGSLATDSVDVFSETAYTKRSSGFSGRILKTLRSVTLAGGIDWLSGSVKAAAADENFGVNISGPYAPGAYSFTTYNFWSKSQSQLDLWGNSSWEVSAAFQLDGSGRVQFVKNRRAQASYNVGLILSPLTILRVKLGYAYAYRLPSIAEQFAEDAYTAGNSDLQPETARSIIGTISYQSEDQRVSAEVTGFRQTVESLIQYRVDSETWLSVPVNVERFKSIGLDFDIHWSPARNTSLNWSGVWQKAEQSTDNGGKFVDAYYVPDLKWRADLEQAVNRFHGGVNVTYTSDRSITMYGGAQKVIRKVYEWGMAVGAEVTKNISMSLIGYDLTDERRPDQFGFTTSDGDYPGPGRRIVFVTKFRL